MSGLTKNKKPSSASIAIPLQDIPQLVEALQKVYLENTNNTPLYTEENQHHYFDHSSWRDEVDNRDTVLGYHEWVEHQIDSTTDDLADAEMRFDMSAGRDPELADEIDDLRRRLDPEADQV